MGKELEAKKREYRPTIKNGTVFSESESYPQLFISYIIANNKKNVKYLE